MYPPPPALGPVPPEPRRFLGRFAMLYGIGGGVLCYAIGFGASLAALHGDAMRWFGTWVQVAAFVTLAALVAGITLVSIPFTRSFGAGLLISVAIGIVVGNGACFALLSTT
jgi:hypothetical protein